MRLCTVMFCRSRCLLCTVSHSFLIFSFILAISLALKWTVESAPFPPPWSWSSSSRRIIRSRQDRSRSMLSRSLLRMYMREAVHRAKFCRGDRKRNFKLFTVVLKLPSALSEVAFFGFFNHLFPDYRHWISAYLLTNLTQNQFSPNYLFILLNNEFWILDVKQQITKVNSTESGLSAQLLILTGCCGASLSVLKTWATFPLALRCILKLGMAQRVARLMTLKTQHRTSTQNNNHTKWVFKCENEV